MTDVDGTCEYVLDPDDPDVLFTHDPDVSLDDLKRDGDRFEQTLDQLQGR